MNLFELLIAFFMIALSSGSILTTSVALQNQFIFADDAIRASYLAQQYLDKDQSQNMTDFYTIHSDTFNDTKFKTTIGESFESPASKSIVVTVMWKGVTGYDHKYVLNSHAYDRQHALTNETCSVHGDWHAIKTLSSLTFAQNPLTGVAMNGSIAYVTADGTTNSLPDLYAIDMSDPTQPRIVSQLNTGPGLSDIQINGSYAYVGNTSINGQLQIIDIHNPQSPKLITTYKLPGIYSDNTTVSQTLTYANQKIYLGTAKSQIAELHIIDVQNPLQPREVGTYETNTGINALAVTGSRIYVASPASEEIQIVDSIDLQHITKIDGYDARGGSGNGKSIAFSGNILFLGRTLGSPELYALQSNGLLTATSTYSPHVSINTMRSTGALLFAGAANPNSFIVWDIKDVAHISPTNSIPLLGTPQKIICTAHAILLITQNQNIFYVLSGTS